MIPAILAAKPAMKYGVLIGLPVLILLILSWRMYSWGYDRGHTAATEVCQATLAKQLNDMARQAVEAHQIQEQITQAHDVEKRTLQQEAEALRRKASDHGKKQKPVVLSADVVGLYEHGVRMSNQAGAGGMPSSNPSPGTSQVSGGSVSPEAAQRVSVESGSGEPIELTTEELKQAVIDAFVKLGEVKADYKALSDWNEGREALEIKRLGQD